MALYHKYRPQQFSEVIGQDHVVKTFSRQIITGTLAHAYIFSGSRGIGKTTISRLFAKAINCTNRKDGSAEPCNACSLCEAITNGRSIDVIEIDAASNTGVDNVRENIIENVQFQPTTAKYKVFIIDEVHMLSTSSFNALLKTLEEPPSYVVFILATTELHKIPETILSRCQRYVFSKVPRNILGEALDTIAKAEKLKLDPEVREAIISKADGGVRDAVSLLDQIMSIGESHITREQASIFLPISPFADTLRFLEHLLQKDASATLGFIQNLSRCGSDMAAFLETLLETVRALMIVKIQGKAGMSLEVSEESLGSLEKLAQQISSAELLRLIDITLKRRANIKNTPLLELPLELIVLEWIQNDEPLTVLSPPVKKLETKTKEETQPTEFRPQPPPTVVTEATPESVSTSAPAASSISKVSPDFQVLKNKWGEVIKCVEKQSPSLVSLLKSSKLLALDGNVITLEVQYKLHQDKFNQKEYKLIMEKALEECLGASFSLKTEVAAKETGTSTQSSELDNLAAAFGGVVI